jgi:type VI secretion system secreted protein VgrG
MWRGSALPADYLATIMANELHLALRGNRPDYVFGTPLEGWTGPPVVRWRAREALGKLFAYDIVLRRLVDEGPFLAQDLLNGPATLRIATEARWREVHGIVSEVQEIERTSELSLFAVRLVPAFFRATQRIRSRTFVDQTLRDILVHVLENRSHDRPRGAGGLAAWTGDARGGGPGAGSGDELGWGAFEPADQRYRLDVREPARLDDPALRAYVVQFEESDCGFLQRLLEEEGLTFTFDHGPGMSTLHITDRPGTLSEVEGERTVRFRSAFKGVGARDRESVRALWGRAVVAWGHVEVRDFDPARPQATELGVALDTVVLPGRSLDPDGSLFLERRYPSRDEGVTPPCSTPATLAQERKAAHRSTSQGLGTHRALTPGLRFTLTDDSGLHGEEELVCLSVMTFATQLLPADTVLDEEPWGLAGRRHDAAIFENSFEVLPVDVRYRPPLATPRPRIDGVHTAVVSAEEATPPGGAAPEIHRNERGDVRLRFPWDERVEAGRPSSTWVRVSQGWAGAGYGQLFTPRVGQEVLVAYLGGDPDRPLIVGRVHNAIQPVEYEKPTISTIKTRSSPASDGFNELRFDDDAGQEEIFLHAQKNLNETVLVNHATSVGGNQSNGVGGNQSDSVDGNQSNVVKGNRSHRVTGTEDVTVTGNVICSFESNEIHMTGGKRSTSIHGHESLLCVSGRTTLVQATESLEVQGIRSMQVTGPNTEVIGGPHIVTAPVCTHHCSSLFQVVVGGSSLTIRPGSIRLKTPGASISLVGDAVYIDGTSVEISGDGVVGAWAGGDLKLRGALIDGSAGTIKWNG